MDPERVFWILSNIIYAISAAYLMGIGGRFAANFYQGYPSYTINEFDFYFDFCGMFVTGVLCAAVTNLRVLLYKQKSENPEQH